MIGTSITMKMKKISSKKKIIENEKTKAQTRVPYIVSLYIIVYLYNTHIYSTAETIPNDFSSSFLYTISPLELYFRHFLFEVKFLLLKNPIKNISVSAFKKFFVLLCLLYL